MNGSVNKNNLERFFDRMANSTLFNWYSKFIVKEENLLTSTLILIFLIIIVLFISILRTL